MLSYVAGIRNVHRCEAPGAIAGVMSTNSETGVETGLLFFSTNSETGVDSSRFPCAALLSVAGFPVIPALFSGSRNYPPTVKREYQPGLERERRLFHTREREAALHTGERETVTHTGERETVTHTGAGDC